MVHETIHMFGFEHCIFFDCCLNGANSLHESDKQSSHLCPVCLHKLYIFRSHTNPFEIEKRYLALLQVCRDEGLEADARWIENRLKILSSMGVIITEDKPKEMEAPKDEKSEPHGTEHKMEEEEAEAEDKKPARRPRKKAKSVEDPDREPNQKRKPKIQEHKSSEDEDESESIHLKKITISAKSPNKRAPRQKLLLIKPDQTLEQIVQAAVQKLHLAPKAKSSQVSQLFSPDGKQITKASSIQDGSTVYVS